MTLRGCCSSASIFGFFMMAPGCASLYTEHRKKAGKILTRFFGAKRHPPRITSGAGFRSKNAITLMYPSKAVRFASTYRCDCVGTAQDVGPSDQRKYYGRNRQKRRASRQGRGQTKKAAASAGRG